jgi:CheY-like chemotaxis protein
MANQRVLLVEDSEPLRKVLAEKLRDDDFDVSEAGGGEEALKSIETNKPDVILTDIVMFPMDGLEFARQVRDMGTWGAEVPLIALTNQNSSEDEKRLASLNLTAYLVKSDTGLEEVVRQVQKIFKRKD